MHKIKILSAIPSDKERKVISVRLPERMIDDIAKSLTKKKLSIRRRSQWVSNALIDLFNSKDYVSVVLEEWMNSGKNKPIQVTLEKEAFTCLEEMETSIQAESSKVDLKSSIIRSSIIQYLIKEESLSKREIA